MELITILYQGICQKLQSCLKEGKGYLRPWKNHSCLIWYSKSVGFVGNRGIDRWLVKILHIFAVSVLSWGNFFYKQHKVVCLFNYTFYSVSKIWICINLFCLKNHRKLRACNGTCLLLNLFVSNYDIFSIHTLEWLKWKVEGFFSKGKPKTTIIHKEKKWRRKVLSILTSKYSMKTIYLIKGSSMTFPCGIINFFETEVFLLQQNLLRNVS